MMDTWAIVPTPWHRAQCRRTTCWRASPRAGGNRSRRSPPPRYEGTWRAPASLWFLHACKDGKGRATVRQSVCCCAVLWLAGWCQVRWTQGAWVQGLEDKDIEGQGWAGQGRARLGGIHRYSGTW